MACGALKGIGKKRRKRWVRRLGQISKKQRLCKRAAKSVKRLALNAQLRLLCCKNRSK